VRSSCAELIPDIVAPQLPPPKPGTDSDENVVIINVIDVGVDRLLFERQPQTDSPLPSELTVEIGTLEKVSSCDLSFTTFDIPCDGTLKTVAEKVYSADTFTFPAFDLPCNETLKTVDSYDAVVLGEKDLEKTSFKTFAAQEFSIPTFNSFTLPFDFAIADSRLLKVTDAIPVELTDKGSAFVQEAINKIEINQILIYLLGEDRCISTTDLTAYPWINSLSQFDDTLEQKYTYSQFLCDTAPLGKNVVCEAMHNEQYQKALGEALSDSVVK
jgi:hypothetical protein